MEPRGRFTVTPALNIWSVEQEARAVDNLIQKERISQLSYAPTGQIGTNYAISNARISYGPSLIKPLLFNHFQFRNQLSALISHQGG